MKWLMLVLLFHLLLICSKCNKVIKITSQNHLQSYLCQYYNYTGDTTLLLLDTGYNISGNGSLCIINTNYSLITSIIMHLKINLRHLRLYPINMVVMVVC